MFHPVQFKIFDVKLIKRRSKNFMYKFPGFSRIIKTSEQPTLNRGCPY